MSTELLTVKIAKYLSWIIAGIFILLPFHAFLTTWAGSNFGHLDLIRIWKEIILALLICPALWLVSSKPELKSWLLKSWITRLFGLYVLLHLVLGGFAYADHNVNHVALVYSYIINLRFIGFFIICYIVAASHDFLKNYWARIVLGPAAVVILFGLIQRFILPYDFLRHFGYGPQTIPAYQTVDSNIDYRRIQSTLRGANPLGAYLVLVVPGFTAVLRSRTFKLIAAAASFVVLFYSYSRSAWIGVGLALGLMFWWASKNKKTHLLMVGAVIIACVAGIYSLRANQAANNTLFHTNSSSVAKSSNNAHLGSMEQGIEDVLRQPLGGGPGTAGPASYRNNHPPRIAENYFVQIAQETGIEGLAIFVAINLLVALELWRRRGEALPRILLASLAGLTFVNMVSHAWTDDTVSYLWWGLAGIAIAAAPHLPVAAPAILKNKKAKTKT